MKIQLLNSGVEAEMECRSRQGISCYLIPIYFVNSHISTFLYLFMQYFSVYGNIMQFIGFLVNFVYAYRY